MASSADTPRARALGAELRQARERAELSQRALAARIGRASSHIARWEGGKLIPSEADTAQVLQALGVTGADRERLLALAREASDPNWIAPGIERQLAALSEYERTASLIVNIEPLLIPGLMQTYHYARTLMVASGAGSGEADERAQRRVGRQHVITGPSPRSFVAVIGEYALRYPLCDEKTMSEQLEYVLELAKRDNITVQVLPMDRPVLETMYGSWALIEFDKAKPIVHLEHHGSSATITDSRAVARYRAAVDTLRSTAMSPDDSTGLIADAANDWRQR